MNLAIWLKKEGMEDEMNKVLEELRKMEKDETKKKLLEPKNLPKNMRYPDDYG